MFHTGASVAASPKPKRAFLRPQSVIKTPEKHVGRLQVFEGAAAPAQVSRPLLGFAGPWCSTGTSWIAPSTFNPVGHAPAMGSSRALGPQYCVARLLVLLKQCH